MVWKCSKNCEGGTWMGFWKFCGSYSLGHQFGLSNPAQSKQNGGKNLSSWSQHWQTCCRVGPGPSLFPAPLVWGWCLGRCPLWLGLQWQPPRDRVQKAVTQVLLLKNITDFQTNEAERRLKVKGTPEREIKIINYNTSSMSLRELIIVSKKMVLSLAFPSPGNGSTIIHSVNCLHK